MKERVLVYGAGSGGEKFYINQNQYDIIAFADKDKDKQDRTLHGRKIISPLDIKEYLEQEKINKIVIASMFCKEITEELVSQYAINRECIVGAPKRFLIGKAITFENKQKYNYARKSLIYFLNLLNESKVKYYLDFGTLLGFKRDGDFIPWDDDIDLSIVRSEVNELLDLLLKHLEDINENLGGNWSISTIKNKEHNIVEIKLEPIAYIDDEKYITIDFYVWDRNNIEMYNRVNSASEIHFDSHEELMVFDIMARIYNDAEGYLTSTYGKWKEPNKNMSFGEHNDKGRFNSLDISKEYRTLIR